MSMRVNSIAFSKLQTLIKPMDVPQYRVEKDTLDNIQWLEKNLGKRNQTHRNYREAMSIIMSLLKEFH